MLAVVAILGIVAALAIPQASSISPAVADATAGEIASALRFASREAQRTNAWHVVAFDTAAQSLRIYRLTISGAIGEDLARPVTHPVDKRSYSIAFGNGPAGAIITGVAFRYDKGGNVSYASFGPDGAPSDLDGRDPKGTHPLQGDGMVTLRHGNIQRVVRVAAVTGRVTY